MELTGIAGVAGITMICYLCGMGVKLSPLEDKYIPLCCGLAGAVLGLLGHYLTPNFPAETLIDAVAVGIASGLAATGLDQLGRQMGE